MLVETELLSKRYGRVAALVDCSFGVAPGEVLGLLGPNGAGKTTLLRTLLGYLKPTSGRAAVDGFDCYRQPVEVHRRLSYLPGDARLFRNLDGRETLRFFTQLRPGTLLERALAIAERLQLDLSRRVSQMSTGMRQKLALVVALAPDVPLVILDEPTTNLDPTVRRDVVELIRDARRQGKTVLFSSHVLSEAEQACDRVIVLRDGRLVDSVRVADVLRQHRIRAELRGELAAPPPELAASLQVTHGPDGGLTILTAGDLAPVLGWLARQPLVQLADRAGRPTNGLRATSSCGVAMNRVLVMRSLRDSWILLAGCGALVFGFIWLRVWVASKIRGEAFIRLFSEGLKVFSDLLPVPIEDLASPIGRAAFSYEELPVILLMALWTVTRGSECVVGRVGAGTMEMLLAQPLRRVTLVTSHTAVTVAGIAALGATSWLGLGAGLATSEYNPPPPWKAMLPAAGSYVCLGVFFLGFATGASALARTRSQAVAAFIAFYVIELAVMIIARLSPNAQWLEYLTITTAYDPTKQTLDLSRDFAAHWPMYWQQNAVLAGLGLAMGLVGTVVFCRRDLPAPL